MAGYKTFFCCCCWRFIIPKIRFFRRFVIPKNWILNPVSFFFSFHCVYQLISAAGFNHGNMKYFIQGDMDFSDIANKPTFVPLLCYLTVASFSPPSWYLSFTHSLFLSLTLPFWVGHLSQFFSHLPSTPVSLCLSISILMPWPLPAVFSQSLPSRTDKPTRIPPSLSEIDYKYRV